MIPSAVSVRIKNTALDWKWDGERRLEIDPHDAGGRTLLWCSAQLFGALAEASAADEELTPAEFGRLPHVDRSRAQVQRWCRNGLIVCRPDGRGYRIRRGAALPVMRDGRLVRGE
jgi:hypothetical protein